MLRNQSVGKFTSINCWDVQKQFYLFFCAISQFSFCLGSLRYESTIAEYRWEKLWRNEKTYNNTHTRNYICGKWTFLWQEIYKLSGTDRQTAGYNRMSNNSRNLKTVAGSCWQIHINILLWHVTSDNSNLVDGRLLRRNVIID